MSNDKGDRRYLSIYSIFRASLRRSPIASLRRSFSDYDLELRRNENSIIKHRDMESEDSHSSLQLKVADAGREYALHGQKSHAILPSPLPLTSTGSHLLNAALVESEIRDPRNQLLSRQLYIDSMTYLLQGLPPDLTEQEIIRLQSSLPKPLQEPNESERSLPRPQTPSVLHRSIYNIIVAFCLIIRLALPYIKYLLALAYRYERTHHVTETALTVSMNTVDSLGRKSMDVTGAAMRNELVMGAVAYCVEGVCGGLNEGLGEGMKAISARNEP